MEIPPLWTAVTPPQGKKGVGLGMRVLDPQKAALGRAQLHASPQAAACCHRWEAQAFPRHRSHPTCIPTQL